MKIRQIRHATIVIEYDNDKIIVDPMFSKNETMLSLQGRRLIRGKKTNPMVGLPISIDEIMDGVTGVLITHNHFDHIDKPAIEEILKRNLPVYSSTIDKASFSQMGLNTKTLDIGIENDFLGGKITPIPCEHGKGVMKKLMGDGVGYYIKLPNEPTLYISGDTLLTATIVTTINLLKPDYSILNAGGARLPVGSPILMPLEEVLDFIRLSSNSNTKKVILSHLDTMDHCFSTRDILANAVKKSNLDTHTLILKDGEYIKL